MSGIATETNKYQNAIAPYKAKIVDTRKTTPNFRMFEKYSVKVGGGALHRFNLSDCVLRFSKGDKNDNEYGKYMDRQII